MKRIVFNSFCLCCQWLICFKVISAKYIYETKSSVTWRFHAEQYVRLVGRFCDGRNYAGIIFPKWRYTHRNPQNNYSIIFPFGKCSCVIPLFWSGKWNTFKPYSVIFYPIFTVGISQCFVFEPSSMARMASVYLLFRSIHFFLGRH